MTAVPHRSAPETALGQAWGLLRLAALGYLAAWGIHSLDHLRRGTDVLTPQVMAVGTLSGVLQVGAIWLVLRGHRAAPGVALVVGLQNAVGIGAVHLLPEWGSFSDAFPGARDTGVTALSWVAGLMEIAGALLFAGAAAWVIRHVRAAGAG